MDVAGRDPDESRAWLEKAARQGYARAECDLGVILTNGFDVPQDRGSGSAPSAAAISVMRTLKTIWVNSQKTV